mmetsp:Transcript_43763/g.135189  ORF Transcript_43763/g.135189 Transcript_43763/m.135189 type:complete len:270 (-) Transcript_43763:36-845(-)
MRPLIPSVKLGADGAKHGLHDPIGAVEPLGEARTLDLRALRVIVVRDVDFLQLGVEAVEPADLVFVRGAGHDLDPKGVLGALLLHEPPELPREVGGPAVGLPVREDEEQHRPLAPALLGHSAEHLSERRPAARRPLQGGCQGRVPGTLDALDARAVEEEHVDARAVKAAADLRDHRDRLLCLVPARRRRPPNFANLGRRGRAAHAARVVHDKDDLVVLQANEVVGLRHCDLEAVQHTLQPCPHVVLGHCKGLAGFGQGVAWQAGRHGPG